MAQGGLMARDEGLGGFGWLVLLIVLLEVLFAIFWPAGVFYVSLVLAFVVLGTLAWLCAGKR